MLRLAALGLLLVAPPAGAQDWATFSHDMGAGAATCPYDDPEAGETFCFAVSCLPGDPTPYIRVGIEGHGIDQYSVPLQVHVDGRAVARLFLTRLSQNGLRDYGIPFDARRDAELIEALRAGTRATFVFGVGLNAVIETVTLTGSQAAIDQVPLMCGSVPLTAEAPDD